MARHGVPRRLQDDRPGEHDGRRCCSRAAASAAPAGCATSTPATCRARSATSKTRAARRAASALIARYGYLIRDYRLTAGRPLPVVRDAASRDAGAPVRGPDRLAPVRARRRVLDFSNPEIQLMNDTLGRPLRNLRLSVTDRCNLRCEYCMPEDGLRLAAARGRAALRGDRARSSTCSSRSASTRSG